MKTPKFFVATAMDYLGRNGDKGQVMQIGLWLRHVSRGSCVRTRPADMRPSHLLLWRFSEAGIRELF